MLNWSIMTGLVRFLGLSCVMGAICWTTAETAAPFQCQVFVHVTESWVEVTVDETVYLIADPFAGPIACELNPGRHVLTMRRGGRVLYREEFTLGRGEERVLTAWARADLGPAGDRLQVTADPRTAAPVATPPRQP
jgi:hypothetical protein